MQINDARDQLEFLLTHICKTGARIVLERDGQVVGALIGLEALEQLRKLERNALKPLAGTVLRFDDPFEPVWP